MIAIYEALIVLRSLEIREDVLVAPARGALCRPAIVVAKVSSRVHLRVDARTTTKHLRLGIPKDTASEITLQYRGIAPRSNALGHLGESGRHAEQPVAVAAAGLEQKHADGRIDAQTVGEHATSRAGADDDIVERQHLRLHHFEGRSLRHDRRPGALARQSSATD